TEKELQIEAAVRRIRAGQDQRPITTEYEAARNEVFLHISSGLRSLAGVIDYLNENAFQGPKVLLDYVDAYSHRLTYKASLAGDSTHNGLAYLEHYGEVYSRLIKLFEDTARKIEAEFKESDNNIDPYLLKAIDAERKEIMERAHIVHGFYYHGEFSTPVDQSSNDYAKAEVVIKEVVAELGQVTKTGKWNPELVRVKHAVTGRDADIETPSSAEFSRIASMVPKLRQIGFLGNGD
ncbi:MAG: hypothetical protein HY053_00600, partial [Proteobacteria bacterium]|nr:hypothetical protein [Pseudomonadota bacterium]